MRMIPCMNKRFIGVNIFLLAVLFLMSVTTVYAQLDSSPSFENPLGNDIDTVMQFFKILLGDIIVPIGSVIVAFFIIWSGFLFVTAGGNEEKIRTARTTFTWTMIGAAILLGAWTITPAISILKLLFP